MCEGVSSHMEMREVQWQMARTRQSALRMGPTLHPLRAHLHHGEGAGGRELRTALGPSGPFGRAPLPQAADARTPNQGIG